MSSGSLASVHKGNKKEAKVISSPKLFEIQKRENLVKQANALKWAGHQTIYDNETGQALSRRGNLAENQRESERIEESLR